MRPSQRSTSTAVNTPQSATRPKPGELSSTMPPSILTAQSPSRSTTAQLTVKVVTRLDVQDDAGLSLAFPAWYAEDQTDRFRDGGAAQKSPVGSLPLPRRRP